MQKNLIILGESGSGKSRLATNIAGEKYCMINFPSLSTRRPLTEQIACALSEEYTDPEVIIIDDVRTSLDIVQLSCMATIGICINRKGELPKLITPRIIFVCNERIMPGIWIRPRLTAHYDVIYLKNIR